MGDLKVNLCGNNNRSCYVPVGNKFAVYFFIFISFPQFIYDLFHISLTLISFTGTYEPTIDLLLTSVAS